MHNLPVLIQLYSSPLSLRYQHLSDLDLSSVRLSVDYSFQYFCLPCSSACQSVSLSIRPACRPLCFKANVAGWVKFYKWCRSFVDSVNVCAWAHYWCSVSVCASLCKHCGCTRTCIHTHARGGGGELCWLLLSFSASESVCPLSLSLPVCLSL